MAYCSDKTKEIALKKMVREIRNRCASVKSIRIVSVHGAMYADFVSKIKQGRYTVEAPYDTYVLFGGWGDYSRPIEFSADRTRRVYNIWADEFACVSVGIPLVDSRWGSWRNRIIWGGGNRWGDWNSWGSWNRRPPMDLHLPDDRETGRIQISPLSRRGVGNRRYRGI